jgi:hypothetical protein
MKIEREMMLSYNSGVEQKMAPKCGSLYCANSYRMNFLTFKIRKSINHLFGMPQNN